MADFSSPDTPNFPASIADDINWTVSHDDATDRDAATPEDFQGAHGRRIVAEVQAVQEYVQAVTGLQVTDGGGLDVDFSAGRVGDLFGGAPTDIAADTVTLADDDVSYVEVNAAGTVSDNITGFTSGRYPLAQVTTSGGDITELLDKRTIARVPATHPKISMSVGAEAGDAIAVTLQIDQLDGTDIADRYLIHCWLSDTAYGAETGATPDGGCAWSTGAQLEAITANERWSVITDASGTAVVDITESGVDTWYLVAELDGKLYVSSAITFA